MIDGPTAFRIRFPVYFLHFHAGQSAVFTQELKGVDIPASGASLFVAGCSLEGARPVGPGVLRIFGAFRRTGHNLYLRDAAAALTMGCADAVAARVAAADDEHVLVFGGDALIGRKLHAGEDAVLLREEFEGQVHAPKLTTRNGEVARRRCTGGDDEGVILRILRIFRILRIISKLDALLLHEVQTAVDDGRV